VKKTKTEYNESGRRLFRKVGAGCPAGLFTARSTKITVTGIDEEKPVRPALGEAAGEGRTGHRNLLRLQAETWG
jgi:hypothetical protein